MLTLEDDQLVFRAPDVEPGAKLAISFQRSLRVPLNGQSYPLPITIGQFPVRHVEDYPGTLSAQTQRRGGVILPMWQAEALWIRFQNLSTSTPVFPFAVKVAAGKVNVLTGQPWHPALKQAPQDYVVCPEQRWLSGFAFGDGPPRQFVAHPLGTGHSAEELITSRAEWGGIQISVLPLRAEAWAAKRPQWEELLRQRKAEEDEAYSVAFMLRSSPTMGLAPGGFSYQRVPDDFFDVSDWDLSVASRVFVTLVHSKDWEKITGESAPAPPTAKRYKQNRLPWLEVYGSDRKRAWYSRVLASVRFRRDHWRTR